jgi:hypothetical protein
VYHVVMGDTYILMFAIGEYLSEYAELNPLR